MRLKLLGITILLIFSSLGVGWTIVERELSWPDLIPKFGGMDITVAGAAGKGTVSTLGGFLVDQGALAGVLTTLNDLHYPILSVDFIEKST